jgi:predicted metal-dependent HD superfamily phosphohydrolase
MSSENKSELFPIRPEYFDYLEKDLKDLFGTVSGDERKISELTDLLISKYSEKHRAYHNLSHVCNLIQNAADSETKIADDEAFRSAIWFHDAIYDPQSKTNEIESAALAVESLTRLDFPQSKIEKIEKMILATRKHDASELDDDGRLFLDLDLGILGANPVVYDKYSKAIRAEYAFVPEALYRAKRREILEAFLQREFIYYTEEWRESRESVARFNIANEIKELS